MASKLFAFTVSKKIEPLDAQARNQWVGDGNARGWTWCRAAHCTTGQGYGLNGCADDPPMGYCQIWGVTGYYICDCPFGWG